MKRKAAQAKLELDANPLWLACAREQLTNIPDDCFAVTAHDIFA